MIGQLSAKELQDKGVLSIRSNVLQLADTHVGFSNYAQELNGLHQSKE